MEQIVCKTFDDLPDAPDIFSDYKNFELIISSDIDYKFRENVPDFKLKTQSTYLPYDYRINFLHPSQYLPGYLEKYSYGKLLCLYLLAKRGASIKFIVDSQLDSSVIFPCMLMAKCFEDCQVEGEAFTNVPFPVKKEEYAPHNWIWGCYWYPEFPLDLDEKQSKKLARKIKLNFPGYIPTIFPVRVITTCEDGGVTAFSVRIGQGKMIVVPFEDNPVEETNSVVASQEKVLIEVKEFPVINSLGDNIPRVIYDVVYKGQRCKKKAGVSSFFKILSIYYSSQNDNSLGFVTKSGTLEKIVTVEPDSVYEKIVWSDIFLTKNDEIDGSFNKTLYKLIRLILPDNNDKEAHKVILGRDKGENRVNKYGLTIEKYSNLTIKFQEEPFQNFQKFTTPGKYYTKFAEVISTFKEAISPLIAP